MRPLIRCLVTMLVVLVPATAAVAQLTVATDASQYTQADIVTITVHNAGPSPALFVSSPACYILQVDTMECVYGCTGLPVLWEMSVGETMTFEYDPQEDAVLDPIGTYRVELTGSSGDPGSILSCDYQMLGVVPSENGSWGEVKALFR